MVVAFLDLLGFSDLIERSDETALEILETINCVVMTKVMDGKTHPLDEYERLYPEDKGFVQFVEKNSVSAINNMIFISDSMILGSNDNDLFISQLCNLLASLYINYSRPFGKSFSNIDEVFSYAESDSSTRRGAFPILFRGGLSEGNSCAFYEENAIKNGKFCVGGYNVFGKNYLKAVKLEHFGKGPRRFCDKCVVDSILDKSRIRVVDLEKEVYEIVWTIEGCEATGCSASNLWLNVLDRIKEKMLPPAINLYNYYMMNEKDENVIQHYRELLTLVCRGIVKYAKDKCDRAGDAAECINSMLIKHGLGSYEVGRLLEGFIDSSE